MIACVFNCGYCQVGNPHYCRTCSAINQHRTINCPNNITRNNITSNVTRNILSTPKNVAAYIYRIDSNKQIQVLCRRGVTGHMYGKIFSLLEEIKGDGIIG